MQQLIPDDTFHTARVIGNRRFLAASTAWPGMAPADVEIGKLDELVVTDRARSLVGAEAPAAGVGRG